MEWTPYLPWPWQRFRLIDGSLSKRGREVMRRQLLNGCWQYREMTAEELAREFQLGAW